MAANAISCGYCLDPSLTFANQAALDIHQQSVHVHLPPQYQHECPVEGCDWRGNYELFIVHKNEHLLIFPRLTNAQLNARDNAEEEGEPVESVHPLVPLHEHINARNNYGTITNVPSDPAEDAQFLANVMVRSAFNKEIVVLEVNLDTVIVDDNVENFVPSTDVLKHFAQRREIYRRLIHQYSVLRQLKRLKFSLSVQLEMARMLPDGNWKIVTVYERSPCKVLEHMNMFHPQYDWCVQNLWNKVENFLRNGSGWVVRRILKAVIHLYSLPNVRVGSWQPTPRELSRKHVIVNVEDDVSNNCFKWAVVSGYCIMNEFFTFNYSTESDADAGADKVSTWEALRDTWEQDLDFSDVNNEVTPLPRLPDFEIFEKKNKKIALCVWEYTNEDAHLTTKIKRRKAKRCSHQDIESRKENNLTRVYKSKFLFKPHRTLVQILMLKTWNKDQTEILYHCTYIRFFDKLLGRNRYTAVCPNCLTQFNVNNCLPSSVEKLKEHTARCIRSEKDSAFDDASDEENEEDEDQLAIENINVDFKKTHLKFDATTGKRYLLPMAIFADFETWSDEDVRHSVNANTSASEIINIQKIMGYCLHVCCTPSVAGHLQEYFPPRTYCGPDADIRFLHDLQELRVLIRIAIKRCSQAHRLPKSENKYTAEEAEKMKSDQCHLCRGKITNKLSHQQWASEKEIWTDLLKGKWKSAVNINTMCSLPPHYLLGPRVVDHCHWSGAIRGPAHTVCNLHNQWRSQRVPIYFHNGGKFDAHLLLETVDHYPEWFRVKKVIPRSFDHFICINFGDVDVKDTLNYFPTTLDKQVASLFSTALTAQNNQPTVSVWQFFPNTRRWLEFFQFHTFLNEEQLQLVLRKGVYPYEYFTSIGKLSELQLPPRQVFYSRLTRQAVTELDYDYAQTIFNTFNCTNLRDYTWLYVSLDVMLLADVCSQQRQELYLHHRLDLFHYSTLASYALDVALMVAKKANKANVELCKNPRMLHFINKCVIGGVSMVDTTYFCANNPRMDDPTKNSTLIKSGQEAHKDRPLLYKPDEAQKTIVGFDVNAQYASCMCKPLPVGDFRWEDVKTVTKDFIQAYKDEDPRGWFVKVAIRYPARLHAKHDTFPLAPERIRIPFDELSQFSQDLVNDHDLMSSVGKRKLIPNLKDKENYYCHIKNLQQYLDLGMELVEVKEAFSFKQEAWLKPFIDIHTKIRQINGDDPFLCNLMKLVCNIVYGKCLEDASKHTDLKLVYNAKELRKLVARFDFVSAKIYSENTAAVQLKAPRPLYDRPRQVGACVLAYAKWILYNFHYNYVMQFFEPSEVRLLMTDTDSLYYGFTTNKDVYQIIKDNFKDQMDYSNYPSSHPDYDNSKHLQPGCMKEDFGGAVISEFVGLKSKMYSIAIAHVEGGGGKQTAKGVPGAYKKTEMLHAKYVETIQSLGYGMEEKIEFYKLQAKNHEINLVKQSKVGLGLFNDKKYVECIYEPNLSFGNIGLIP